MFKGKCKKLAFSTIFLIFTVFLSTTTVFAGATWNDRADGVSNKVWAKSSTYKAQLQALHSEEPYQTVKDEDTFVTKGGNRYYPWIVGKDITGYGAKWNNYPGGYVFGPSDSIQEYPFLYLHRVTRNLNDNNGIGLHSIPLFVMPSII